MHVCRGLLVLGRCRVSCSPEGLSLEGECDDALRLLLDLCCLREARPVPRGEARVEGVKGRLEYCNCIVDGEAGVVKAPAYTLGHRLTLPEYLAAALEALAR